MRTFPIIPIWLMLIICILSLIYIIKFNKEKTIKIIIVVLLFIMNLRIMIPGKGSEKVTNELSVLFVIDTTISMEALDYNGENTRLSGVKEDCKYIIDELDGAKFSIITFDNDAKVRIPFTTDNNIAKETIEITKVMTETYAKGSSLNTPIDTIKELLKSTEEQKKIIFFISDGEITDESNLKSYSSISKYIEDGAVLGYGTKKGGYMKYESYNGELKDILDSKNHYNKAVSKIDEKNLKKIASDLKIDYIQMNKQSDIKKKIESIKKRATSKIESNDKSTYKDTYYIFIIPLLILSIIEFNKVRSRTI